MSKTMQDAKRPSLKDKIAAQEKAEREAAEKAEKAKKKPKVANLGAKRKK